MKIRGRRRARADAQLVSAVAVLKRELEHQLVTQHGYTKEQAEGSVSALIDLPGLPEKLRIAA